MAIVISGAGINMGGNPVSNASKIDSVLMNENGASVATETQVGTANSALVKTALNATGAAPIYACRAWVNFNGTGTVAIRGSGNVSSVTDNGVGNYTVNFTTAMPDAAYAAIGSFTAEDGAAGEMAIGRLNNLPTTTSCMIYIGNAAGTADVDKVAVYLTIQR